MRRFFLPCIVVGMAVVACSSESDAPALDTEQRADLTVQAIVRASGSDCKENPLYVRDQLLDGDTLVGEEEPMPVEISQAISDAVPSVVFVDFEEVD